MNIKELRAKHPEYSDMSDLDFAQGYHKKFYSDMPFDEFAGKVGVDPNPANIKKGEAETDWGRAIAQTIGGMGASALQSVVEAPLAATSMGASVPTGVGRVYAANALGEAMGGQAYDLANEYLFGGEKKSGAQHALDSATDFAVGVAIPPVIDKGVSLAKAGLSTVAKPITNKLAGVGSGQLMQDHLDLGIRPMAGAVSGNRGVQGVEQALSGMPASARKMQGVASEVLDQTADAAQRISGTYGPKLTPQGAGEVTKRSAQGAVDRFKGRSNDLFERVAEYFPAGEQVPVQNTLELLQSQAEEFVGAPALGSKFNSGLSDIMERVKADAPDGLLDFTALKRLRTDIGNSLGDAVTAVDDVNRAQLKHLYGALTSDMETAAMSKGGPAARAYQLANRYYRQQMTYNIPALEKVLQAGTDEAAYNLAISGAKDGGSRLAILRRNFKPAEWDAVAGTVLGRMGRATPGAQNVAGDSFSASTFMTNWNRLAPEAKHALFGGSRYKTLQPQLDKLARVVASQKDVMAMANSSKTGSFNSVMATLTAPFAGFSGGGATGVITGTAAVTIPPYVTARLITSPKFVNWLARGATISASKPASISTHLAMLPVLAEKSPELRESIGEYSAALGLPYRFY